ncbi:MAG TPA: DNA glycosylase [Chloroflexota bacterium]|nr:DNA glycosylase [Chloroflexota bacterium]
MPPPTTWSATPEHVLPLNGEPLSLDETLACGQAFRWWRLGDGTWEGVSGGRAWRLRQDEDQVLARALPEAEPGEVRAFLHKYLALDVPAREVHAAIGAAHPRAAEAARQFAGLRIIRQDSLETVLTFTIATATNVPRVTRSVRELCRRFGAPLATVEGATYHDFPTVAALLAAPTDELYGPCNLAYRARSIQAVAGGLAGRPADWLSSLRALPYADAHRALDDLPFYGPKVADCACLFGLGFDEAVPVDVHVWAIAHELFGAEIPTRTLTPRTYVQIGERFREIFGPWAGWAQQYLFCARRAIPVRDRFRPGRG